MSATIALCLGLTLLAPPPEVGESYAEALAIGQRRTSLRPDEAVEAFSAALRYKPGDARALAGRGWAHMHRSDPAALDAAEKDLRAALRATENSRIRAAAHYNLGLLMVRRGRSSAAKRHFGKADSLKPSKAAKAQLAGRRSCSVEVSRKPRGEVVAGWVEAWPLLTGEILADLPPPKTELEARERLCGAKTPCPTDRPSAHRVDMTPLQPQPGVVRINVVIPLEDGKLRLLPKVFEDFQEYHCVPDTEISTRSLSGGLTHVSASGLRHVVEWSDDLGEPCAPESEGCWKGCFYDRRVAIDVVARGPSVLVVERRWSRLHDKVDGDPAPWLEVDLEVSDERVEIVGCGQRRTLSLR